MNSPNDSSMTCDGGGRRCAEMADPNPVCAQVVPESRQGDAPSSGHLARVSPGGLDTRDRQPTELIAVSPAVKQLLTNRWTVYGVLLCCGPIGLPLLWLSPRFSTLTKSVLTLLLMAVTLFLPIIIYWYFCESLLRPLATALGR